MRGAYASLVFVAAAACAQRVALPLAALWLGDRGPRGAVVPLLAAAGLSFARARAADHLARVVRLRVVELFTSRLARGVVVPAPPPEVSSARLATALPVLVSFAVDGVAIVLAGAVAAPVVTLLLASALGKAALLPIFAAGLAGALVTALSGPRLEATWGRTFDHARAVHASASAAFSGAAELVVHGRAAAFVEGLRAEVAAWSRAELGARTTSALASWGALSATIAAAAVALGLFDPRFFREAEEHDLHRALLLVLAAIPTVQMTLSGLGAVLHARSEIAALRELGGEDLVPGKTLAENAGKVLDPRAAIRLERVGYRYPPRQAEPASQGAACVGRSLVRAAGRREPRRRRGERLRENHPALALARPGSSGQRADFRGRNRRSPRGARRSASASPSSRSRRTSRPTPRSARPSAPSTEAPQTRPCSARSTPSACSSRCAPAPARTRPRSPFGSRALSRGQARRVMLARALVRDADLVVLDEPEAHLDAASVAELDALLRRLAKERRVIAAIHDPNVQGFAHHVLRLP